PRGATSGKCIFLFQAEDDIRCRTVTRVQTCALPISLFSRRSAESGCMSAARCLTRRPATTFSRTPAKKGSISGVQTPGNPESPEDRKSDVQGQTAADRLEGGAEKKERAASGEVV